MSVWCHEGQKRTLDLWTGAIRHVDLAPLEERPVLLTMEPSPQRMSLFPMQHCPFAALGLAPLRAPQRVTWSATPLSLSAFVAIGRLSFIAFSFPFCPLSPECIASVCAHMHAHTHSWGGQRSVLGSSGASHLVSLTGTWGSTIRLGWQARKHQGFTSFCVLSVGVTGKHHHTWLFKLVVGIELRFSCLQVKYLTKWAISWLFSSFV